MPFVNEHSARIVAPGKFDEFRRQNDRFGPGIDAIFGITGTGEERRSEVQAIRFDSKRFTVAQARQWLKDNDFDPILFEPAIEEDMAEAVLPFRDLPIVERPWDAGDARRRIRQWAADDDETDFTKYSRAFLVVDGPRENLTSYKLPFADIVDGRLRAIRRGIFAAAGVLSGARGGADLPSGDLTRARNHLSRYYRKMELVAPWERGESVHEAVHIRGTHWVPVPEDGQCPVDFPNKLKAPGTESDRCYTDAAARQVRMMESDPDDKHWEVTVNLHGFPSQKLSGKTPGAMIRFAGEMGRAAREKVLEGLPLPKDELGNEGTDALKKVQEQGRKFIREESKFQQRSPDPLKVCGACRYFLRNPGSEIGTCQVVEGPIPWFSTSALFISAAEYSKALAERYDGRIGPRVAALKNGRTRLSDEERKSVMAAKAVWHDGPNGEETPAVWKSIVNGKVWYVTNSHRALNVTPTLKGTIARFHDFIKSTA